MLAMATANGIPLLIIVVCLATIFVVRRRILARANEYQTGVLPLLPEDEEGFDGELDWTHHTTPLAPQRPLLLVNYWRALED
jgi:hypothetical protein